MMLIKRTYVHAAIQGAFLATLMCGIVTFRLCIWHEPYPKPPIYQFATNISYQTRVREPGNDARIIRFTTPHVPEAVLAFYAESLVRDSWHIDYIRSNEAQFFYLNGEWNPVFSLRLSLQRSEGITMVVLEQLLDGSSSSNWPPWSELQTN